MITSKHEDDVIIPVVGRFGPGELARRRSGGPARRALRDGGGRCSTADWRTPQTTLRDVFHAYKQKLDKDANIHYGKSLEQMVSQWMNVNISEYYFLEMVAHSMQRSYH